jgi:hypothetical protein
LWRYYSSKTFEFRHDLTAKKANANALPAISALRLPFAGPIRQAPFCLESKCFRPALSAGG